jgi:hypothetical protein
VVDQESERRFTEAARVWKPTVGIQSTSARRCRAQAAPLECMFAIDLGTGSMHGGDAGGVEGRQQPVTGLGCEITFREGHASVMGMTLGRTRDAKTRQPTQRVLHDEAVATTGEWGANACSGSGF